MSDVAADVAAVAAFSAADTTDVLAADTTDVLSAAKAADGGFCPAKILMALPRWLYRLAPNSLSTMAYGLTPGPSKNEFWD